MNRIEKYAALLARQCDASAVPGIDLGELLHGRDHSLPLPGAAIPAPWAATG